MAAEGGDSGGKICVVDGGRSGASSKCCVSATVSREQQRERTFLPSLRPASIMSKLKRETLAEAVFFFSHKIYR